jgi:hypothetical protein
MSRGMRLPLVAQQEFGVHLTVESKAKGRRCRGESRAVGWRWRECCHRCETCLVWYVARWRPPVRLPRAKRESSRFLGFPRAVTWVLSQSGT